MPVITVYNAFGLERSLPEVDAVAITNKWLTLSKWKSAMIAALQAATCSVAELKITDKNDVLVHLLDGMTEPWNVTYISVDVLFDKKERTHDVREKLAKALRDAVDAIYSHRLNEGRNPYATLLKHTYKIEVAVRRFNAKTDVYLLSE